MHRFQRLATRRQFLVSSTATLASVALGAPSAHALGTHVSHLRLPRTAAARRTTPGQWLPPTSSAEQFRALALVAMEAARGAGADFADIRMGVQRDFAAFGVGITVGYGVRACVNGTWSFQAGTTLTSDAVALAARTAVSDACTASVVNAKLHQPRGLDWAHTPVVSGEWRSPVDVDPFAVTLNDYIHVSRAAAEVGRRLGEGVETNCIIGWQIETRVFASTDGSLVTQEWTRGGALLSATAVLPNPDEQVEIVVPDVVRHSVGFEAALDPAIPERLTVAAEQAIRWRELRQSPFTDVGRYSVVLDGAAMAGVLGYTVSNALDGDRVADFEADASGRSFLTPVAEIVAATTPQFSPLLTMTSGRTAPSLTAVQWDDDGVVPDSYTLIERGRVIDYHTTRETAPHVAACYAAHTQPLRSHGRCLAPTPGSVPMSFGGDVRVNPGSERVSVDDLMRDMGRGFCVMGASVRASPGLTGGFIRSPLVVEVQQGKPVRRLRNVWFAFTIKSVASKALVALGDARTLGTATVTTQKGMPWQTMEYPMTAPAAFCKEVDVVRMDISA